MGLFNRKSMEQRQDDAMRTAEKIGQGKGFVGRMTKMVMGSEFTDSVGSAVSSARTGEQFAALVQAGAPTQQVTLTQVADMGASVNDNPLVALVFEFGGQPVQLQAMVSRLQVPRPGDRVIVAQDPSNGQLVYGGLAPAA
ncbi:hypothetical protein [Microbacterium halophytorum]|uniref:hypothetical protein n=1 Tax=Microbacterium halophytorum TaxID=2067568 RepID=UPI00131A1116|nr:hypothetical protein [Microbacterium halophytorum]